VQRWGVRKSSRMGRGELQDVLKGLGKRKSGKTPLRKAKKGEVKGGGKRGNS